MYIGFSSHDEYGWIMENALTGMQLRVQAHATFEISFIVS